MNDAVTVHEPDGIALFRGENDFLEGDPHDFVADPIIVAYGKTAAAEFPVPSDPAEQLVDGDQCFSCAVQYGLTRSSKMVMAAPEPWPAAVTICL